MKKMNNKGFSLVELIVVIAIMAVLIGVLAPQFLKYVEKSRQSTDVQNVQAIKSAIEVYVADTGDSANCTITVNGSTAVVPSTIIGTGKIEGIQATTNLKSKTWPTTPVTYTYSAASGWGTPAAYANSAAPGLDMADIFK